MRISDWSSDVCSSDLLTTDLSALSENQKQMIPLLIDAARIMDSLFWYEAYGRRDSLLDALDDERSGEAGAIQEYVRINYGPWDRLDNNRPRPEEHTSELQSLMRISYAVFCLKKKTNT